MKPLIFLGAIVAVVLASSVAWHVFGDGDWDRNHTQVVTTQSGETILIERDGWGGPPFGLLFIPLIIFGLFWAFGGRRGGGCDRGPYDGGNRAQMWSDWHRNEHEKMAGTGGPGSAPPVA